MVDVRACVCVVSPIVESPTVKQKQVERQLYNE